MGPHVHGRTIRFTGGRLSHGAGAAVALILLCATPPTAAAAPIAFEFIARAASSDLAGLMAGDLLYGTLTFESDAPFTPGEFNPTDYGTYHTTAAVQFVTASGGVSRSIPEQPASVTVTNDLGACCQRHYQFFDEFRLLSPGPVATYEFSLHQYFNPPATGFLDSLDLPASAPALFPVDCPSQTVPCVDGEAFFATLFRFSEASGSGFVATVESLSAPVSAVPEPGALAMLGLGAIVYASMHRRRERRRRPRD